MPNSNQATGQMADKFAIWKEKAYVYAQRILALPNDSFEKTVVVAFALCLVGAVLVSGSAVVLKPLQVSNKAADEKRNILEVVGMLEENTNVEEAFKKFETKLVDLESGDYTEFMNAESFDQRKASKDPGLSVEIPSDKDIAKIGRKSKLAKVYLVKEEGKVKAVILPVSGYGLWSTMHGFMALEGDGQTVIGLNLFDQAETPGLGGEVVNPNWKALWKGKKVYKESGEGDFQRKHHAEVGEPVLSLVKGSVDPSKPGAQHQVDGLAGATLTSNGVNNLVRYWLGSEGFAPYLAKLRAQRG
ncbi:MAG: Na(+)-translocating NADH-quinone reductase subunit C [Methylococcaceae bacterium]|nr:Na(+)-translocating NADH-quinone reductase subunit C [Methylococcaceae bacterium]